VVSAALHERGGGLASTRDGRPRERMLDCDPVSGGAGCLVKGRQGVLAEPAQ
jgi:hypothetical protein